MSEDVTPVEEPAKPKRKKWAPRLKPKYCSVPNCGKRPDREGLCVRHGGTRYTVRPAEPTRTTHFREL